MSWFAGCFTVGAALVAAVGCGGKPPMTRLGKAIALVPSVAMQAWYRSPSICGQGPYELEIPVGNARWGEEFELRLATPRRVQLHAVIVADQVEVEKVASTFDRTGRVDGEADNHRCVADVQERLAASRGGPGGGTTTVPVTPVVPIPTPAPAPEPPAPSGTGQLELDTGLVPPSIEVVRFGWGERGQRAGRIRIRLWSIDPNDLEGVLFGVARVEWRPNVPEAEYEAHLARLAAAEEADRLRRDEELRRRQAEADRRRRERPPAARTTVTVEYDAKRELELYKQREAKRRREAELLLERQRKRQRRIALVEERRRRREQYCATHPEDRGCWGAGGMKVHLDLEKREGERARYCAATPEDARCWDDGERARRRIASHERIRLALAPPKQPEGPPPAALAETVPPKLSLHAEWRPGYWQWTGSTWTWLAGMWRVPESDIVAEQTTTAPVAPPPPRSEAIPPPPMQATIWVNGFWQWNGTSWVWVAGSYQARPAADMSWRPTQWRARGSVHVLVPGGWVRVRAGGR